VIAFPPSATLISENGRGSNTALPLIQAALDAHLVPLVHGDVIFDKHLGGTIFSTEEVFMFLADALSPARILLAGRETGVFEDFKSHRNLIGAITPESYKMNQSAAGASASIDVTGGMQKKVNLMVDLVSTHADLSVQIFSGCRTGVLKKALLGGKPGTMIRTSS
jgi:isopentenyl phosphate kinase